MSKNIKKIFCVVLLFLTLALTGCLEFVSVTEKIEIDTSGVPSEVTPDDFKLNMVILVVTKANGDEFMYPLTDKMLAEEELSKLNEAGTHTLQLTYEHLTVEFEITLKENYSDVVLSFEVNGGNAVEAIHKAKDSQLADLPVATKKGYKFAGWYLEPFFETKADGTVISKDMKVYAKWTPLTNVITFNYGYELPEYAQALKTQNVLTGSKVVDYGVLKREGYTFAGWYLDSDFTKPFDFNTIVDESFTIYAKWTQ